MHPPGATITAAVGFFPAGGRKGVIDGLWMLEVTGKGTVSGSSRIVTTSFSLAGRLSNPRTVWPEVDADGRGVGC